MHQRLLIAALKARREIAIKVFRLTFVTALFVVCLLVQPAKADFLGLAPGDYAVTLSSTSSLCGGVNCTGTVHIGTPGSTGFDWNITIGLDIFSFDGPGVTTGTSANGLSAIACESNTTPVSCSINDSGSISFAGLAPPAILISNINGIPANNSFQYTRPGNVLFGNWSAVPLAVPEPMSGSLLLFGLGSLGLWRRLRAKQD